MIKLVVTDMDGTLTFDPAKGLTHNLAEVALPHVNRQAILDLLAKGITVAVATGRLLADITALLGADLAQQVYKMPQNGSYLFDPNDNELSANLFSENNADYVYTVLDSLSIPFSCSLANVHYYDPSLDEAFCRGIVGKIVPLVCCPPDQRPLQPANICVMLPADQLKPAFKQLAAILGDQLNVAITGPNTIDINELTVSKGLAIARFLPLVSCQPNEVAVIGDSYNDRSMFVAYAQSFVMDHAPEDLKATAKQRVTSFADIVALV